MGDEYELIYVHDPMCSWCWGFRPALETLCSRLPPNVRLRRLLGGLAPDSDQPMPRELRERLQETWRRIEQRIPGTHFNHAFWNECEPRRSTYPACRAVIAARILDGEQEDAMTLAIQQAYYRRAMNPSDDATLARLALEIGLDGPAFAQLLGSEVVEAQLQDELTRARALGVNGFPSLLLLSAAGAGHRVDIHYTEPQPMLDTIQTLIA